MYGMHKTTVYLNDEEVQADRADPHHADVVQILRAEAGPLVASAIGVAEAEYLILTRLGIEVELAFLEDLAEGTFQVECLTRTELVHSTARRPLRTNGQSIASRPAFKPAADAPASRPGSPPSGPGPNLGDGPTVRTTPDS